MSRRHKAPAAFSVHPHTWIPPGLSGAPQLLGMSPDEQWAKLCWCACTVGALLVAQLGVVRSREKQGSQGQHQA